MTPRRTPRWVLALVAPLRLAHRDGADVYRSIAGTPIRCVQGRTIGEGYRIPQRHLSDLLTRLEARHIIERDPGPHDEPYRRSPWESWWRPGRDFDLLAAYYGERA